MQRSITSDNRRWWALGLLAAAQFMVIMDTSIIGVALPDIQDALGFSQSGLSWIFNAYVVAFGGLLLLGGRLSDLLGPRRVFIAGWAILTGASVLAGLATNAELEVAGRALQGVGAALIAPSALALLMGLFGGEPRELGKAFAIYGAAAPAGGTAGVFLGGVLTEWADWRWVFLVNIPVGLAALALSPRLLPSAERPARPHRPARCSRHHRRDLARRARHRPGPRGRLVVRGDPGPARRRGRAARLVRGPAGRPPRPARAAVDLPGARPAAANVVAALLGAAWIPMWFFLNLYLQQVLGYGAFEAGAALLPMTATIMVLMVGVTGRLVARFGVAPLTISGLAILAAGIGWLALVPADGGFVTDVLPPQSSRPSDVACLHPRDDGCALGRSPAGRRASPRASSTPATRWAPRSGSRR